MYNINMIRKTIKVYNRIRDNLGKKETTISGFSHTEKVIQTTYWFLFIPFYTKENVIYDNF
jgi:hypothetical protein